VTITLAIPKMVEVSCSVSIGYIICGAEDGKDSIHILSCLEGFIADFSAASAGAAKVSASLCMYPFLCVT